MIEAEMYGMIPSAKTVSRRRLPPEKRSTMPEQRALHLVEELRPARARRCPGVGTWAPSR